MIIRYRAVYNDGKKGDILCKNSRYLTFVRDLDRCIGYEMCAVVDRETFPKWLTPESDVVVICFYPKEAA